MMATLDILQGVRPKKPIFVITRGYTEELWQMTTTCWEEDPANRPAIDVILGKLNSAAEQWKPKPKYESSSPSPVDDATIDI